MSDERDALLQATHDEHSAAVWRYVVRLTGDRALADDIVQEVLLRAWRKPEVLDQSEGRLGPGCSRSPATSSSTTDAVRAQQEVAVENPPSRAEGVRGPSRDLPALCGGGRRGAGLPSLLARVPIEEVPGEPAESPQSDLVAGALAKHRIRRRRRRWAAVAIGSLTAAAAAIVLVVVVGVSGPAPSATAVTVELASTTQEALTADVRMQPRAWGSELSTRCRYTSGAQPTDPPAGGDPSSCSAEIRYGLRVTDRAGVSSLVSTWRAEPGSDVDAAGATDVRLGDIRHLEIRSVDSGTCCCRVT